MSTNKNLQHSEAAKKLKEVVEDIDICLFCTDLQNNDGLTARPMSSQKVDEEGNIWFFSDKNSDKNQEIAADSKVQLFYSDPSKSSFVVITGEANIVFDKQKVEEYWGSLLKTWFKEGKDDPNLSLIKVSPTKAYYWDVKGNQMVNFFKMLASVATGKTLVDAEEGELQV